jgi:hypothetical protein
MVRARPTILTAFVWAYWDLYQALWAARRMALIAFAVLSIGVFAAMIGPLLLSRDPIGQFIARQGFLIGLAFLMTPYLLSVHRFVLLGEAPTRYRLDPTSRRFQLFFGWLAVTIVLASIPSFLHALTTPKDAISYFVRQYVDPRPSMMVTVAAFAVAGMIEHFLVLFPAVAVDAPGVAWQNAIRDTRNHIVFVSAATILPLLSIALVVLPVTRVLDALPKNLASLIVNFMWLGALLVVGSTLMAVVASRLYQVLGDRLNAPLSGT